MASKKITNGLFMSLVNALKGGNADPSLLAARAAMGGRPNVTASYNDDGDYTGFSLNDYAPYIKEGVTPAPGMGMDSFKDDVLAKYNATKAAETAAQNVDGGATLPQFGHLAFGAMKEHPLKTMALGALGAGNIGGLVDNNKFGGQLGGLALGGLGSYLANSYMGGINPYTAAMLTMGGGQLGALFDKLRANREQQRGQMQQQQMPRR